MFGQGVRELLGRPQGQGRQLIEKALQYIRDTGISQRRFIEIAADDAEPENSLH